MKLAITLAVLTFFLWMVRISIAPVLIAGIFVIVLQPVNDFFVRKLGKRQRFAPTITTILTFLVLLGPATGIGVLTVQQLRGIKTSGLTSTVKVASDGLIRWAQSTGRFLSVFGVDMSSESLHTSFEDGTQWLLTKLAELAGATATETPDLMIAMLLFGIAFFFGLKEGKAFVLWLEEVLPFSEHECHLLFAKVQQAAKAVMLGQVFTGAVQGALTLIALFALQVPGAFLWGILAFFLSFIPLFGTAPVTLGATIYLFAVGRPIAGVIMCVAVVIIGASDNIVRPWAASGEMHPLLSLIAIFGGLATLGPSGIFLGPIVAALAVWAIEEQKREQAHESRERA